MEELPDFLIGAIVLAIICIVLIFSGKEDRSASLSSTLIICIVLIVAGLIGYVLL
jgi:hypothetical protein